MPPVFSKSPNTTPSNCGLKGVISIKFHFYDTFTYKIPTHKANILSSIYF